MSVRLKLASLAGSLGIGRPSQEKAKQKRNKKSNTLPTDLFLFGVGICGVFYHPDCNQTYQIVNDSLECLITLPVSLELDFIHARPHQILCVAAGQTQGFVRTLKSLSIE